MASEEQIETVARAIAVPCGRCRGRGTERHQLDRDPAAGYGEHPCPNCGGDGRSVFDRNVTVVARRAIEVLAQHDCEFDHPHPSHPCGRRA